MAPFINTPAFLKASLQAGKGTRLMVFKYLHSSLRVETLSFEEAADFNPQVDLFRLTPEAWPSEIN
jgi:hypothetical protein